MRSLLVCLSFIALFSLLYVEVFVLLVCCVFFSVNNEPVITDSHHMVEPPALLLCSSGEFHEDVSCIIVTAAPPRAWFFWWFFLPAVAAHSGSTHWTRVVVTLLLAPFCWFLCFPVAEVQAPRWGLVPPGPELPPADGGGGGPRAGPGSREEPFPDRECARLRHPCSHLTDEGRRWHCLSLPSLSLVQTATLLASLSNSQRATAFISDVRHSQIIDERCIIMFCSCSK